MATLDPSIILGASQPNFLAITGAANQMAQNKLQDARQNALQALMQQQGPAMMAGDLNALNALAGFDPQAALGIQQTRQGMAIDAAQFAAHQKAAADATAQALKDSQDADAAAKAAADVEQMKQAYLGGFGMFQSGDKAGLQAYIQAKGLDKALGVTVDNYPYMAAMIKGATEGIDAAAKLMPKAADPFKGAPSGYILKDPANPAAGVAPLEGYVPPKNGTKITTPDGTVIEQGNFGTTDLTSTNTTDAQKSKMAYDSLTTGLNDYEKLITGEGSNLIPGQRKDALIAARTALQLQMKELFNLGVLNGPDLDLMNKLLVDPTDIGNNALDAVGIANLQGRMAANLMQLRATLKAMVDPKLKAMELPPADGPKSGDGKVYNFDAQGNLIP